MRCSTTTPPASTDRRLPVELIFRDLPLQRVPVGDRRRRAFHGRLLLREVRRRRRPGTAAARPGSRPDPQRSEEHTSELQSLMRISYAVFCLKKKKKNTYKDTT